MPNTYKSAAVPFVNQKGERSMKRVKVERYVAGKKPAYAMDDDEEYYTTDDDDDDDDDQEGEEQLEDAEKGESDDGDNEDEEEKKEKPRVLASRFAEKPASIRPRIADDDNDRSNLVDAGKWTPGTKPTGEPGSGDDDDDDDEEDDPRFRMLKQVESKSSSSRLLASQISALNSRTIQNIDDKNVVIEDDDDEDEEDVRMRHALARSRALEEPIGPQIMLDEFADKQLVAKQLESEQNRARKEETEDILKDLKLTGIKPKNRGDRDESSKADERLKDMLEAAKQEAAIKAQLLKKIDEDNKRELEKEALDKGDIGAYDMETVKTDDEDEELAYEEWKLREIKRVLRDRSERLLETKAR